MKVFLEIFKIGLKTHFEYRWSFIISMIFDPLILVLYISLLNTIYNNSPEQIILGYTLTQMIWYFGATKFFYHLSWTQTDKELSDAIVSGEMALKLLKPLSVMKWQFGKTFAGKSFSFVFEFLPTFFIFSLIIFPDFLTVAALSKYLFLSLLSFIMFFLMSFIIGTISFLWQRNEALVNIKNLIINVLAGVTIPLDFYPDMIRNIVDVLPFQYLFYIPIQFFLNKPNTQHWTYFGEVVGIQVFWIVILYITSKCLWSLMIKKYISVGG